MRLETIEERGKGLDGQTRTAYLMCCGCKLSESPKVCHYGRAETHSTPAAKDSKDLFLAKERLMPD